VTIIRLKCCTGWVIINIKLSSAYTYPSIPKVSIFFLYFHHASSFTKRIHKLHGKRSGMTLPINNNRSIELVFEGYFHSSSRATKFCLAHSRSWLSTGRLVLYTFMWCIRVKCNLVAQSAVWHVNGIHLTEFLIG